MTTISTYKQIYFLFISIINSLFGFINIFVLSISLSSFVIGNFTMVLYTNIDTIMNYTYDDEEYIEFKKNINEEIKNILFLSSNESNNSSSINELYIECPPYCYINNDYDDELSDLDNDTDIDRVINDSDNELPDLIQNSDTDSDTDTDSELPDLIDNSDSDTELPDLIDNTYTDFDNDILQYNLDSDLSSLIDADIEEQNIKNELNQQLEKEFEEQIEQQEQLEEEVTQLVEEHIKMEEEVTELVQQLVEVTDCNMDDNDN